MKKILFFSIVFLPFYSYGMQKVSRRSYFEFLAKKLEIAKKTKDLSFLEKSKSYDCPEFDHLSDFSRELLSQLWSDAVEEEL